MKEDKHFTEYSRAQSYVRVAMSNSPIHELGLCQGLAIQFVMFPASSSSASLID